MRRSNIVRLNPDKRVLFLTKDPELIRRQLAGELDLSMKDLRVEDLLDDINTDAMTPAWVCFNHRPEDLARNAYAGLIVDGAQDRYTVVLAIGRLGVADDLVAVPHPVVVGVRVED